MTLSDKSTSYFDEYLDEIVYFFQNSKAKLVIFEDLDRFKDAHIFETLRELNLLLNDAEQVGSEPIQFVYAIRDSIFEQLDAGQSGDGDAESSRTLPVSVETRGLMSTNRTKFFDLVIPMVPFISHKTSRELIAGEVESVEESQRPSPEVIDLLSVHLTDMRLIKNICNEFDVFRPNILGTSGLDGLTPDRLFASIVYKNVYLADYERIRNGTSLLDLMYSAFREWVKQQAAATRRAEREAEGRLRQALPDAVTSRSERLGERLQAVLLARSSKSLSPQQAQIIHLGVTYRWPQLLTSEFWRTYLKDPQDLSIVYRPAWGAEGGTVAFEDLQTLMNERLSAQEWETQDLAKWRIKMTTASDDHRAVTQASLADALVDAEKLFLHEGKELSLLDVAAQLFTGADLVVELMKANFIDENFTLYVTQFPGQGSASAMNFILKAVQPDVTDMEYRFRKGDSVDTAAIDSVVRTEGVRLLEGKSIYNIEIFDRLLATDPLKVVEPIRRLALHANVERDFIEAYVNTGREAMAFVERLSGSWTGIFNFLLNGELGVRRTALLSAALVGASADRTYELSDEQRALLEAALPQLDALTSKRAPQEAVSLARLLKGMGIIVADLSKVAEPLRDELIARDLYQISRTNLATALGNDYTVSLDGILESNFEEVFAYVLAHFQDYVAALDAPPLVPSVGDPSRFAVVLASVAKIRPEALQEVAERAGDECMLQNLRELEAVHWPAVVRAHRLKLTSSNVAEYVMEHGLDSAIAEFLSFAGQIEVSDDSGPPVELSVQFLNADVLEDDTKKSLVRSMHLPRSSIAVTSLVSSAHSLLPALVSGGWVEDDAAAFKCLGEGEWPIKQALIARSKAFPSYMSTVGLTGSDLRRIAASLVRDEVKQVLIDRYAEFEGALGQDGAKSLLEWAAARHIQLEASVLVSLASKAGAAGATASIQLLGTQAPEIDLEALIGVLRNLGSPYDQLTVPGRDSPRPPRIDGMTQILARLQLSGIVSKYMEHAKKPVYEVFKRHS